MNDYIWVVEINWHKDKWDSTLGVALKRKDGYAELREWRENNPGIAPERFRLSKYVREK